MVTRLRICPLLSLLGGNLRPPKSKPEGAEKDRVLSYAKCRKRDCEWYVASEGMCAIRAWAKKGVPAELIDVLMLIAEALSKGGKPKPKPKKAGKKK